MAGYLIFLLGSVGIFILSIRSLAKPNSHGFPRFFAFEAILGLVVLNAPMWFTDPFSLPQIISWALLIDSIALAMHAFYTLKKAGQPDGSIQDDTRIGFEKTTHLVTSGPYHFIRHPMYSSLICFALGVFLKHITLLSGLLALTACVAFVLCALFEERELRLIFGNPYAEYMQRTKRFIPFIY